MPHHFATFIGRQKSPGVLIVSQRTATEIVPNRAAYHLRSPCMPNLVVRVQFGQQRFVDEHLYGFHVHIFYTRLKRPVLAVHPAFISQLAKTCSRSASNT
jgi:hypothetical protein